MKKKIFGIILLLLLLVLLLALIPRVPYDAEKEHEHAYGKWTITKEATCKEVGEKVRSCECGDEEVEFIKKISHTVVIDEGVLPTCETEGLSVGKHCSVCDVVLEEQVTIETTGHLYDGSWDYLKKDTHADKCLRCGKEDAHAHRSSGKATEVTSEFCKDCGYVMTLATGHVNHVQDHKWSIDENYHWHYCTDCNAKRYAMDGHHFGEYVLDTDATTQTEGLMKATCADCGYVITLKIMKTPVLVNNGAKLSWDHIVGATGYYLYKDNELISDLGNVTSYAVSTLSLLNCDLSVIAYTNDVAYREVSNRSDTVTISNMSEVNLQAGIGTDFESYSSKTDLFAESGTLSSGWKTDDYERKVFGIQQSWQGNKLFRESEDNTALKIYGTSYDVIRVGLDINDEIKNPGTYKASIKIKAGPEADNISSVLFRFHNKSSLLNANAIKSQGIYFRTSDDTTAISKDKWTTLEVEFRVTDALNVKDDLCIVLMVYTNNLDAKNPENYALVDDLEIYKLRDLTITDVSAAGTDFEGYSSEMHSELFDPSSTISVGKNHGLSYASTIVKGTSDLHGLWFADSNGDKAVAMQKGYTDLRLAKESNGNVAVKVSKGNGTLTRVGIDVDEEIKNPGTYRATLRVYAGSTANNVGKILFKLNSSSNLYANGNLTDGFYFRGSSSANPSSALAKGEWITLTVDFTITEADYEKMKNTKDLCAVLVVYNSYKDANSYVLIDDFQIVKFN